MHDIRRIREDGAAFDAALAKRGLAPVADTILARDADWRRVTTELQHAQQRRNEASKQIGLAKRNGESADALMAEVSELKDRMARLEEDERRLAAEVEELLSGIPNLPGADVPVGADEDANVEIRMVGTPRERNFAARDHVAIGEGLGLMDFEAAARLSGARFVVLKADLARLERALRTTTQRVNLFDKVLIPRTREEIRSIRLYLGENERVAVVRAKIAKAKKSRAS